MLQRNILYIKCLDTSNCLLVGLGISTHSGIASKVLNILSENGIKYYMITSSEISISLTIEKKDKVKAVQALGKAFDL